MRILTLNNEYPPLGGGQANANFYLYKEFEKYKDLKIDLITASTDEEKTEKTKIGKIYYLNIGKKGKNLHFQTSKELVVWSIKTLNFAKKLIRQEKYDLIVAWSGVPAGYIAYRLNKKFKIPYFVLLRGADVPYWEKRWYLLDKFIFSWLSPRIWRNAKKVIANSSGLKLQAEKITDKKIMVIPNGVDTDFFKPKRNKDKLVKILSVGRLIPRKSFDLQVKILSKIKMPFVLNIVGDGPEREYLEKLIGKLGMGKKIKLLGIKNRKEIKKLYSESDIYLFTSKNEGMSNTLLEAMASGLPIISTNVAGVKELVKDNGIVIDFRNEGVFEESLKKLIKDKNMRKHMGKKSREIAEKMSWENIASKFYSEFKK